MRRRKCNILRSRTGASLSLALLLFLICGVVGALVITAGSTAAGRMSQLAEMDQRYYSVSSAAELLANELDGGTVNITRVREVKTVTATKYTTQVVNGRTVAMVDGTPSTLKYAFFSTQINDLDQIPLERPESLSVYQEDSVVGDDLPTNMSFLTARAVYMLFDHNCNTDSAMQASMKKNTVTQTGTILLDHLSDPLSDNGLRIKGSYEVKKDGTLVILLYNANGDPYKMRVTLTATVNESETETTTDDTEREYAGGSSFTEVVTSVTTLTKISQITWKVSGVEKVVSS